MEALKLTSDLPKETLINMDIVIWFLDFEKKTFNNELWYEEF